MRQARRNVVAAHALFLLDWRNFDALAQGEAPTAPYSHDRNLYQFAHEALAAGFRVSFARSRESAVKGDVLAVDQLFPTLLGRLEQIDPQAVTIVTSAGLEWLDIRGWFGDAKIVAVVPALHMIESPLTFAGEHPARWIEALRRHVDVIITQNARMRDVLVMLSHWLARWDPGERVIVAPLGFVEVSAEAQAVRDRRRASARAALGVLDGEPLIVNSGGAWGWTDCDTFITALVAHLERKGGSIRAYFPGLRQADNLEPNPVAEHIERLMAKKPRLFGRRLSDSAPICIEEDWTQGRTTLAAAMDAADIGLSVSKNGFEGWQSHRVRFIDYLEHRLPVMCTPESLLAEDAAPATLQVRAGDVASYRAGFAQLTAQPGSLTTLASAADVVREAYSSKQTYGKALQKIINLPRRDLDLDLEDSFVDHWKSRGRNEIKNQVINQLFDKLGLN